MQRLVRVMKVPVGSDPFVIEIENNLKSLQVIVGGYIEFVGATDSNLLIVCNEEGKLDGLPANRLMRTHGESPHRTLAPLPADLRAFAKRFPDADVLCGDFLIVASDREGEVISLTDDQITEAFGLFRK